MHHYTKEEAMRGIVAALMCVASAALMVYAIVACVQYVQ